MERLKHEQSDTSSTYNAVQRSTIQT
jgi:hypothetical protein